MENNKWNNIFNRDFYPTPETVLNQMQLHIEGEIILEPSAGKGNIIDFCRNHNAKDIIFCEINKELATICKEKARFIKYDFLKVTKEEISHVTQIIMNPPFTAAKKHILHAWTIAPDGCEITSLCNSEMVSDLRYERGSELHTAIKMYGNEIDLGKCFDTAERKTDVAITCIKLYKPITNESANFEGFYMDQEPEIEGANSIMHYNEVQSLVNSYIGAAKCFDDFNIINDKMIGLCSKVGMGNGFSYSVSYDKTVVNKADFLKELQRRSWKHIFSVMNLNKYLTSGVMNDINKFVENQTQVPFTVKNIYRMFEIIIGTKEHSFNRALVEAVDGFTKHTHENRFGVEGWKTNSGYMLNKKFIINYMFRPSYKAGKLDLSYSHNGDKLNDLIKVLCNITGTDYNIITPVDSFIRHFGGIDPNTWYLNGFFSFKGFKKGTMHLKFEDDAVWEQLNRAYAKIKGQVLPENIKFTEPEPMIKKDKPTNTEKRSPVNNQIIKDTNKQVLNELIN
jgi:hypothetical protein